MMRYLRMLTFQVRQFISIPYFIQVMAVTSITMTLIQFLAHHAWHGITPTLGWVRAGAIGLWSTATCAAGIIGFERYKGTLVHLVLAPIGTLRTLAAVVCAAASFGILALPLSWITWTLLSRSIDVELFSWPRFGSLLAGTAMLWAGATCLSLVVAALFVLTPNAISYEGLLLIPVFLLSGLTFFSHKGPAWLQVASHLLPLSQPIEVLLGQPVSILSFLSWAASTAFWFGSSALLGRRALRLATRVGTLEVI